LEAADQPGLLGSDDSGFVVAEAGERGAPACADSDREMRQVIVCLGVESVGHQVSEAMHRGCAADGAGRHGEVVAPAQPRDRAGQRCAQRCLDGDLADSLEVAAHRVRLGVVEGDRVGAPCGQKVVGGQGRVRTAVRIVEPDHRVVGFQDSDEVVRPDRSRHSGHVTQQAHFQRSGQHGTGLGRFLKHRQGLLAVVGALSAAGPAEQRDRVVDAAVIPAVRVEKGKLPAEQVHAERRTVSTSMIDGEGAAGPSAIASELA
jgi:hypothetical protein